MNEYMKIADRLARENIENNEGGPFGAVVVLNGKVVGKGKNQVLLKNDPTAHAEMVAIQDACQNLKTFDLSGCVLYTSCYPCPMCLSASIWANISTIYYGNTKKDAEEIGFRDNRIYTYLQNVISDKKDEMLSLIPLDRSYTIASFIEYKNKKKRIY